MACAIDIDHYKCKECGQMVCLEADNLHIFHADVGDVEPYGQLFEKAYYGHEGEPRQAGRHRVVDVYCVFCRTHLGRKYIQVGGKQTVVQNNMVKLILQRLLKQQGDQILAAHNLEPVGSAGVNPAPGPGPEVQNPNSSDEQVISEPGPGPEIRNPNPTNDQLVPAPGPGPEVQVPSPNDDPDDEEQNPPPGPPPVTPQLHCFCKSCCSLIAYAKDILEEVDVDVEGGRYRVAYFRNMNNVYLKEVVLDDGTTENIIFCSCSNAVGDMEVNDGFLRFRAWYEQHQ